MSTRPEDALGLYLSIPFCRSKCVYCNFASGVYPARDHTRYIDRLIADLAGARCWAARKGVDLPRRVASVYLGGGTPSLLAPELIARLFTALRAAFELVPAAEITVECAPGQISDAALAVLAAAGVNRVSLGVQSFIDSEARASGRLHGRATALADLDRLRAAGIHNLSVDLIAGLSGQTLASWSESLEVLVSTGVPHASIYMLEVDEDSRLGRELLAGGSRYHAALVPTDEAIVQMDALAIERLGRAGLRPYEISNYSRPGWESRHNLRYWQRRPYLGLGLDASSMLRVASPATQDGRNPAPRPGGDLAQSSPESCPQGRIAPGAALCECDAGPLVPGSVLRTTTTADLASYLAGAEPAETAWLGPAQQQEEAWFLGLRLMAGVRIAALDREFGRSCIAPALAAVARLAEAGLVVDDRETVRLTPRGRLISNEVFEQFLGLEPDLEAGLDGSDSGSTGGRAPRGLPDPRLNPPAPVPVSPPSSTMALTERDP
ncbi:MAG: coproporphyrinogen-III oxidase family protein [Terracidiphilus sp.]